MIARFNYPERLWSDATRRYINVLIHSPWVMVHDKHTPTNLIDYLLGSWCEEGVEVGRWQMCQERDRCAGGFYARVSLSFHLSLFFVFSSCLSLLSFKLFLFFLFFVICFLLLDCFFVWIYFYNVSIICEMLELLGAKTDEDMRPKAKVSFINIKNKLAFKKPFKTASCL